MPLLSAAFAAGGAYVAVRAELKFLWRDVGRLARRVKRLEATSSPHRRWDDTELMHE